MHEEKTHARSIAYAQRWKRPDRDRHAPVRPERDTTLAQLDRLSQQITEILGAIRLRMAVEPTITATANLTTIELSAYCHFAL